MISVNFGICTIADCGQTFKCDSEPGNISTKPSHNGLTE